MCNVQQQFNVPRVHCLHNHVYFLGRFSELVHMVVVNRLHTLISRLLADLVHHLRQLFQLFHGWCTVFRA
ncbi:hypothetical protein D3C86_2169590 [compost metagenome]